MFKIKAQKKVDTVVKGYSLTKEYKNATEKMNTETRKKFDEFLYYYISIEFMNDNEKHSFKNYAAKYVQDYDNLAKEFVPMIKLDTIKSLIKMVSKETEEQPKVAEVINDDKEEMKKAEAAKKINYDEVLNRADELRKEAGVKTAEEHLHDVKETVENTKKNIKNASEKIIKKFKQETDTNKRHMTNLEAYSIIARGKISDGIDYLKNKFSFSF